MKIVLHNLNETDNLAKHLIKYTHPNFFISMNGDLGSGKTTFTKSLGKYLGVTRIINSPTFTIMKIYETNHYNDITNLYHLDVYRLNNSDGDFELEEYFYQNGLVVVEWCDIIKDLIPDDYLDINIKIDKDNRIFELSEHGNIKILEDLRKDLESDNYEIICWFFN